MNDPNRQNGQNSEPAPGRPSTSRWEWVAAAFGAVLVAAIVGYMVYFGLAEHGTTPSIEVQVSDTTRSPSGYVVQFRAINRGGSTAAAVRIRGELRRGDSLEEAETELDYVPPHSERKASLIFRDDPASGALRIAPTSYTDP
ncbi:TIGR02588 family protein [Microvirga pudoricolor]|uniref:TIGR02588 family protein n=1 Tax=Microvirga pudoricolor TaxID=2778729 RepID=UPI0019503B88|nr:TIGR02588 family protein [Microvirga pudoricolor]MBM6595988.1 TIGR02588 family protein [Microvirga pudoricolor]